ncbi:diguanylate cyclase [Planosporangium flavigriseum]|uniref:diguanylate cyclase domain-containing protein n=1 Tax=Planosporangium flavigriseum TaxID=373681 RepID=UPI001439614B|nr:diguanylate cyclase [Planosporangium flavigriseum]NJC66094.1 diguanylate cyclase [Planosporangium flavigriseum]
MASIGLLVAIGVVGWQMNSAAQRTAEDIHRQDTANLSRTVANLGSQYLLLSASELAHYSNVHSFSLRAGDPGDQRLLKDFRSKAAFFPHGAALADLQGNILNVDADEPGLPAADDPGYASLREGLTAGQPGFSSVMTVRGVPLTAAGVPVIVGGQPRGVLVGYTKAVGSHLQAYTDRFAGAGETGAIVDSRGVFAAVSDIKRIAAPVEPAVRAAIANATPMEPVAVEYDRDGRKMVAFVVTGLPGGWAIYSSRTLSDFYGPIRSGNFKSDITLLGMILIAGVALSAMNHRAEMTRRRGEERFAALVKNGSDVVTLLDANGRITYDSPSVRRVLGFPPDARLGLEAASVLHPDDQSEARALFRRALQAPDTVHRMQGRVRRAGGAYEWVDLSVTNHLGNPAIGAIVVNAREITESRRLQERMRYLALHDALTGLPNRRLFKDRLTESLRPDPARPHLRSLLFVDLDEFKPVNDRYGHDAGDELLCQVSSRLIRRLRPSDTLARIGGDEFVILLDPIVDRDEATTVADRLLAALAEPYRVAGHDVRIGGSIGVSIARPGQDPDEMLRSADSAMYRAKQDGGLRYELCELTS